MPGYRISGRISGAISIGRSGVYGIHGSGYIYELAHELSWCRNALVIRPGVVDIMRGLVSIEREPGCWDRYIRIGLDNYMYIHPDEQDETVLSNYLPMLSELEGMGDLNVGIQAHGLSVSPRINSQLNRLSSTVINQVYNMALVPGSKLMIIEDVYMLMGEYEAILERILRAGVEANRQAGYDLAIVLVGPYPSGMNYDRYYMVLSTGGGYIISGRDSGTMVNNNAES